MAEVSRTKTNILLSQISKFGGVGVFLAAISVVIYYITFEIYSLPLYPTYITVFLISVYASYRLNSKYTFAKSHNTQDLLKYYGVYLIGLCLGLLLLKLFKSYTPWSDFVVTIASILPRIGLTFGLSKVLVFEK